MKRFNKILARVALKAPSVLPSESFQFVCSHAARQQPGHVQSAMTALKAELARNEQLFDRSVFFESLDDAPLDEFTVKTFRTDLENKAKAHLFMATFGRSQAFIILFDQRLQGTEQQLFAPR